MWILSDQGFVHSARVLAVRPPEYRGCQTLRIEIEGIGEVRVMRQVAEELLNTTSDQIKTDVLWLVHAMDRDKETLSELAKGKDQKSA